MVAVPYHSVVDNNHGLFSYLLLIQCWFMVNFTATENSEKARLELWRQVMLIVAVLCEPRDRVLMRGASMLYNRINTGDRPALTAVRQIVVDVKLGLNALQQELSSATDRDQVLMETWSRTHHCHAIFTPHTYNQINLPLNISLTSLSHWKNKLALCAFRHGRNWHQSVDTI